MTQKQNPNPNTLNAIIRILIVLVIVVFVILIVNIAFYGYDEYQRRAHPIQHSEIVEGLSSRYGIDKYLVYAIIKSESGFNPKAVSNVGARGLMQIMPDTFEWLRDYKLLEGEDDLVEGDMRTQALCFDDMFTPEHNIRYGVYLIAYHMKHYKNIDNSLAAYHAGDGAVDKWLKDSQYSSNGRTLESIPIPETAHYVNKVNKAYEIYLKLYGG